VVTNSAGSVTSSIVSLTVTAAAVAPSITTQPQGQTVDAGSAASFTVSVGGSAPFTYQWRKNGANISGATAATLNLVSAQSTDAGSYTVVITNSAGSVTSAGASLTINAATPGPTITNSPLSQTVTSGKGVSFTVESSNANAYQWEVSTNNGGSWTPVVNGSTYSGASTAQLTIANASASMSGYLYRTVLTGANGSVTTSSVTLTVASAVLAGPAGVALDRSGNLLAVDTPNNDCMSMALTGSTANLAGLSGAQGADDGQGRSARFRSPVGIAINASNGTAYVADAGNSLIRAITIDGLVSTLAGSKDNQGYRDGEGTAAWFNAPADVAVDRSGSIYVADTGNSVIRKITTDGTVTTLAGLAGQRGSENGTGTAARFNQPSGIAVDASGVIFVADTYNHTIRRITAAGVVSTFAGVPGISGYDDGSNALFNQPGGLALDASGNLYVADTGNNTLRIISVAGVVRTLVGTPTVAGLEDGNGMRALLNQPKDVCLDENNNVWVADFGNAAIRKVTPGGDVSTVNLSMAAASVPESPSTSNPSPSTVTPTPPTTTIPTEVGVGGGGGGAPSGWFLLGLGMLAFMRRGLGARRR
jgi:sugar lactone lactonase YvrE